MTAAFNNSPCFDDPPSAASGRAGRFGGGAAGSPLFGFLAALAVVSLLTAVPVLAFDGARGEARQATRLTPHDAPSVRVSADALALPPPSVVRTADGV